jgi:Secretion system C-terminal sorting domain
MGQVPRNAFLIKNPLLAFQCWSLTLVWSKVSIKDLLLCLFLALPTVAFAQTDSVDSSRADTASNFYFPLKAGDLWQYKEPPPPEDPYIEETRAEQDTMFSNGQTYTKFVDDSYGYPDTNVQAYRRKVGDKIYKYFQSLDSEYVVYDFSKNLGDTVSVFPNPPGYDTSIVTVLDTGAINIFGTLRRYKTFYYRFKHETFYSIDQITDSLGITFSQIEPGLQLYLIGAIIDSTSYGSVTSVMHVDAEVPGDFILLQNYPNPFNPSTIIDFKAPKGKQITIQIYNVLGELIKTLYLGFGNGNLQNVIWDGKNNAGDYVGTGVYFYELRSANFSAIKKLLLIR